MPGSPSLSPQLVTNLRLALRLRRLPASLTRDVAQALKDYRPQPLARSLQKQRYDAVERVLNDARRLDVAMRRADAVFGVESSSRGQQVDQSLRHDWFIYNSWSHLQQRVADVAPKLADWLELQRSIYPPRRRRGNPHDGKRGLRLVVLGAFKDCGIRVNANADGLAARGLRAVLEEAEGTSRGTVSGSTWRQWVAEFEYLERLEADRKSSGLSWSAWAERLKNTGPKFTIPDRRRQGRNSTNNLN